MSKYSWIISCIMAGSCGSSDGVGATCDVVGNVVFGVNSCSSRSWVNGYGERGAVWDLGGERRRM